MRENSMKKRGFTPHDKVLCRCLLILVLVQHANSQSKFDHRAIYLKLRVSQ